MAEKYYSISPYAYCANNSVNAYDLHGDSIGYTKDNNVITMHVTGKVINISGDNINMKRAAKDIASGISSAFDGKVKYEGPNSYYRVLPYPYVHDPKTGEVYEASDLLNWTKRFGRK